MLGSPAGPAGSSQRGGLWPLAPAPAPPVSHLTAEEFSRFGVYSLFPGSPGFGGALYSHASAIGRFTPGALQPSTQAFNTHKDSLFSSAGYTFGAPTPPPGSPYSPVPVTQLELLAKGFSNSNSIIIHQQQDYSPPPLKRPEETKELQLHINQHHTSPLLQTPQQRYWNNVKSEKRSSSSCNSCHGSPTKTKFAETSPGGCSRTNPVAWNPVTVKREPGSTSNPCQVAEVTTSDLSPVVKVEASSPIHKEVHVTVSQAATTTITNGNHIPVGIAVARQRLQQEVVSSPSLPPAGLLTTVNTSTQIKEVARISEIDPAAGASGMATTGGVAGGGALLHCTGDDRSAGVAAWPLGTTHSSALATPTLWQYPAPMPLEPMLPLPVPMPPVGFQLVRDPTSGSLLLLPTTSIEQVQQAVMWPSYPQATSSHVILPPMQPPPLQLLSSASSDYLATSTTLHQHTQTHSTRLVAVTTDPKRKHPLPLPGATLIKIETDCTTGATTLDLSQTKALQAVSTMASNTGTVYTDQSMAPMVTTHVIYQHPTNLILSQTQTQAESACRSQATSPVACLTPPPEILPVPEDEECLSLCVQDASNQTDIPIGSEDENTSHTVSDVIAESRTPANKYNDTPNFESSPIKRYISIVPEVIAPKIVEIIEEPVEKETFAELTPPEEPQQEEEEAEEEGIDVPVQEQMQEYESPASPELKFLPSKPDLSGLELLSNSILEFENCRKSVELSGVKYEQERWDDSVIERKLETGDVLSGIAHMTLKDKENDVVNKAAMDESLGGLGLLCALAEQRFMEEVEEKQRNELRNNTALAEKNKKRPRSSEERRKEKRKRKEKGESKSKRFKNPDFDYERQFDEDCISYIEEERIREHELELERERLSVLKRVTGERLNGKGKRDLSCDFDVECDKQNSDNSNNVDNSEKCACKQERYRTYKNKKSEEEVKKLIASKSQTSYNRNDWPFMNAMELDMRLRLAELQRQYKEKQRELSKLTPRKSIDCNDCSKRGPGRPPKKCPEKSCTPPPLLDKMDELPIRNKSPTELLKPPTLCAFGSPQDTLKLSRSNLANLQNGTHKESPNKRCYSPGMDLSGDSSPEKPPSSKKRKVGRPKKLISSSGLHIATETIVAKKPRSKSSLVGYMLAAKSRMQMQTKAGPDYSKNGPPKYIEETTPVKKSKSHKSKSAKNAESKEHRSCKIRPKLKAEPTVKMYTEDEDPNAEWDRPCTPIEDKIEEEEPEYVEEELEPEEHEEDIQPEEQEEEEEEREEEEEEEVEDEVAVEEDESVLEEAEEVDDAEEEKAVIVEETVAVESVVKPPVQEPAAPVLPQDTRCVLTKDQIDVDKLRVLTAMGGLFYAGRLSAVEAPDVYAITLDGERGNRPHIMSREEILRDAIVEVSPANTDELVTGTRICAYWSQQYRCLYPGSVAEPGTPDPNLDSRFVCVEFDDGDSGRIALEDIRLLPADYPIIEYDPNPLLSLCKRRRRTSVNSSIDERRLSQSLQSPPRQPLQLQQQQQEVQQKSRGVVTEKENKDTNKQCPNEHRERKRLKKKKRDKLKKLLAQSNDKKKKRKHKFCDEHCKHKRHHKKRRKHKKHHHSKDEKEEEKIDVAVEKEEDGEEEEEEQIGEAEPDDGNETAQEESTSQEETDETVADAPDANGEEADTDDIEDLLNHKKSKKLRERQESCESRSKMTAFLPARQLWGWHGKGYKRPGAKGRTRKVFYKSIQRGKETITVGDSAVFLSTGRPDRPYIGKIEAMWEASSTMIVKVKWFYHPEETVGCPAELQYPGALFESPHIDENDVQTISHKCAVLPLKDYRNKLGNDPRRYATIYDNNDIYYLAGYYDPTTTTLNMEPDIPFTKEEPEQ